MGVPSGPAMDSFVDNVLAHDESRELWGIDADKENFLFFSPVDKVCGEECGMADFDSEFFWSDSLDELFQCVDIGKGWGQLEQVVMDMIFQGREERFEPVESLYSGWAELLKMRNRPVDFHDPCKIFSLFCPGCDHVRIREPVEAHVQLNGV